MAFSVGDRVGRFEILGPVGAGGMGEVYRARDPQLNRDVAIKVLPAEFSTDETRRRRFEQEARAASALNHPNILAVHDVGLHGGIMYIVTELLDGETLAARLGSHPLPVRKAVDFALQIAGGLAAAHERGVVHRDIKPANLFVTTDGRIKILDFGLAKLMGADAAGNTETVMVDGEALRPIVGTVAYMSPEQAQGRHIDHRTDIFSFGVVLYEMLAGFPPFRRPTTSETINAILREEPPDLSRSDASIGSIERVVRHCLEKKPEERFQSVRDLAFDLGSRLTDTTDIRGARRVWRPRRAAMAAIACVALAAAAALGAFLSRWSQPLMDAPPAHRVRVMTDAVGLEEFPSISPNGDMLAFTGAQGGRRQIFVQFLAGGPARAVTTDQVDHQLPTWADNNALVYFSPAAPGEIQGAIYRIPALGGAVQHVIDSLGGGDVSSAGRIAAFTLDHGRIRLVSSAIDGSDVRVVCALEAKQLYRNPRWSPDTQWIAYQSGDGVRSEVYVVPASGGTPVARTKDQRIVNGLAWRPDSRRIVFGSSLGSSMPYLPTLRLWEVSAAGDPIAHQLTPFESSYEQPYVHASGRVAATRVQMHADLWRFKFGAAVDKAGEQITRQTAQVSTPSAAPDGENIAYLADSGGHANLWILSPAAQEKQRQITFEDDPAVSIGVPIWSPDGRWIAYVSSKGLVGYSFNLWLVKPDGSDPHQVLSKGLGAAWSNDGRDLYYVESAAAPMKKIRIGADGRPSGEPVVVLSEPVRNVIGAHGSSAYFMIARELIDGRQEYEIREAQIDRGTSRPIQTIPATRIAPWQILNPALSPDGKWLAMPLTDGFTTNIWALSTADGQWRQITDFGDRAVFIARRISWSHDGHSIIAAVGEGDTDIVLLDGLIDVKGAGR